MKILAFVTLLFTIINNPVLGVEMKHLDKITNHLPYVLLPTQEEDEYMLAYEEFIDCVAKEAAAKLTAAQLTDFGSQLENHAKEVEAAMTDIQKLMTLGPPQPSAALKAYIKKMDTVISNCEIKLKIQIEY